MWIGFGLKYGTRPVGRKESFHLGALRWKVTDNEGNEIIANNTLQIKGRLKL